MLVLMVGLIAGCGGTADGGSGCPATLETRGVNCEFSGTVDGPAPDVHGTSASATLGLVDQLVVCINVQGSPGRVCFHVVLANTVRGREYAGEFLVTASGDGGFGTSGTLRLSEDGTHLFLQVDFNAFGAFTEFRGTYLPPGT
jgi:hypothetical protein